MYRANERLILIVEDDDTLRLLVSKQLERLGFTADFACDGAAALERFEHASYCLIFMDIQMPKMDGLEATAAIREMEQARRWARIPIIALTANPDRQRCIEVGMDDFMFKPVMIQQLKTLLSRWTSQGLDQKSAGSGKLKNRA